MLYLTVKRPFTRSLTLMATLLLCACGGTPSNQGTAVAGETLNQPIVHDDNHQCGDKIQYYTVQNYALKALVVEGSRLQINLFADDVDVQESAKFSFRFSLFNQATACPVSFDATHQTIQQFTVLTNDTFSPDYPAGSDVTALFAPSYMQTTHYTEDLPDSLAALWESSPMAPSLLGLELTQAPEFPFQSFTVEVTLDDGRFFSLTTQPLEFNLL